MKHIITNDETITKFRFVISGIISTLIHFSFLFIFVEILSIFSVGLSNLIAAFFGISSSFILNNFFVFRKSFKGILKTYLKFVLSNIFVIFATSFLFVIWSDLLSFDYRIGFVLIYGLIAIFNFYFYKNLIFK